MRNPSKTAIFVLVGALLCAGGAFAQVDLSKYVAIGDSLTAGFSSGGLSVGIQSSSYPLIMSKQFGMTSFEQPLVSDPGIPSVLILKHLLLTSVGVVPEIVPKSETETGLPMNAQYPGIYNNLGIPGAKTGDLLTKTGDIQNFSAANAMYDIVLRFPVLPGTTTPATAIAQAIGAQGTFYTVWIGNNDVLGAALSGVALDGVTLTPVATFQTQYATLLGALRQKRSSAQIVVANIPDVTSIPFVTTIKPYVYTPQGAKFYLIGQNGQLTDGDYLTLGASSLIAAGYGLSPAKPLPEGGIDPVTHEFMAGVILRANEVALIRQRTAELNAVIAAVAEQFGAKLFDVNSYFTNAAAHGIVVGGVQLGAGFLTGGIFSYDGVHPQALGYAVLANEFIKVINREFGAKIPQVNLYPYLQGAATATSVQKAQVVFSVAALKQLLAVTVPEASVAGIDVQNPRVRQRVAPTNTPTRIGVTTPR